MSDSLSFKLNIDINVIHQIYPERLSIELKTCLDEWNNKKQAVPKQEVIVESPIVVTHPSIEEFNVLYADFERAIKTISKEEKTKAKQEYDELTTQLESRIIADIAEDFTKAILINKETKLKLEPHIDTLLFVCLSYYNLLWDTFGEGFNGNIVNHTVSRLTHNAQPYNYRSSMQLQFISELLYYHYKNPNVAKDLTIVTGGRTHITDDPFLIDWFVKLVTADTLPSSLDYNGIALAKLLKHREKMPHAEFLTQLYKFTVLGSPDYSDKKRKVVAEFCLAIHKIFSHYMALPTPNLTGKRSKIYHRILLAFKMDDFSELHRKHSHSKKRSDKAENRLASLLNKSLKTDATNDPTVL